MCIYRDIHIHTHTHIPIHLDMCIHIYIYFFLFNSSTARNMAEFPTILDRYLGRILELSEVGQTFVHQSAKNAAQV